MSVPPRALELGLIQCPACGLVLRFDTAVHGGTGGDAHCPRCALPLQRRKTNSLQRSWAFLIAAAILYIPANLLPVMHRRQLLDIASDTIISGVIELWNAGSWDLAIIVFTASIVVPIIKIAALGFLLITTQRGSTLGRRERTRLYRIIEFVGHWSMLDVFVVALLVTLVHFGIVAQVQPGGGIIAFGAVVVLTMLASQSFDPRLIWDAPATGPRENIKS